MCKKQRNNSIPSRRLFTSSATAKVNKNVHLPRLAFTGALRILINPPIKGCSITGMDGMGTSQPVYTVHQCGSCALSRKYYRQGHLLDYTVSLAVHNSQTLGYN